MPKLLVLAALLGMLAVAAFAGDAAIILDSRSGSLSAPQLDETEAADLIAHIMGLSPLHPKLSRANFPTTNLFKRPNSNLIVLIDGVGSNAITHLSSSMSFLNADASHSALLQQELSTSRSSLASTVTLMTGEAPNAHGIHGRTWLSPEQTEEQIAFASVNSRVPSIADLLLTTLEKSSFVSISSDRQLAAALGPHPQTFSRAHVIFWDETTSSFVSRAGERFLSHDDVVAFVQNALPLLTKARVSLTGSKVEFSSTKAHAVFDLSSARDFALFAELAAIVNTVPSLASVPQDDLSCDLFAVGVASIRLLEEQYGPSSPQVLAGLYLVDAALSKLSAQLDEIYSHKTTRQTLLLGSSVHSANRAARSVLSTSAVQSSSNTTYTEDQVADYQISIWASVFLVIALFVPIYSFMNMDTSSDSILYRIAGPRMS